MNAIIDLNCPEKPLFPLGWKKLLRQAPMVKSILPVNGQDVMLYRFHPIYSWLFPHWIKKLETVHPKLFFTEEMRKYPAVFREESLTPYLLRDFKAILDCFCNRHSHEIAIVCDKENPCPESVISALSEFCSSVTVCAEEESVFEEVFRTALYNYGLSAHQKPLCKLPIQELLLNFSETEYDFSGKAKFLIDFTQNSAALGNTILADYCSESASESEREFLKLKIKHCYFHREHQKISKILWKNEKKS